jgi:hypothetical protein
VPPGTNEHSQARFFPIRFASQTQSGKHKRPVPKYANRNSEIQFDALPSGSST